MKVKSLHIDKFKGLSDFNIDFNDNVTVIIGENGTGKTTILETIYNTLTYDPDTSNNKIGLYSTNEIKPDKFLSEDAGFKGCNLKVEIKRADMDIELEEAVTGIEQSSNYKTLHLELKSDNKNNIKYNGDWHGIDGLNSLNASYSVYKTIYPSHVVYFPSDINFKKYKVQSIQKVSENTRFGFLVDSETISTGFKDFLVYQHHLDLEDIASGQQGNRIQKFRELYNSFFEDKEFIGVKNLEPLFKIKATSETHSVDELSSGEKQIFFRAGALLQDSPKNSIILIDEPEISLHPEWQQKILDFYRNIGENNQYIIATHSPHIVSSSKREEVRVLVKEDGKVKVRENIVGTYGWTVEQLLLSVFDLHSVRDIEVQKKLDRFKELFIKKDRLTESERVTMNVLRKVLEKYLNPDDPSLSMISIEESTEKLKNLLHKLKGNQNA